MAAFENIAVTIEIIRKKKKRMMRKKFKVVSHKMIHCELEVDSGDESVDSVSKLQ